jgi:hypothetical protein
MNLFDIDERDIGHEQMCSRVLRDFSDVLAK